jgi:hypothetical protein
MTTHNVPSMLIKTWLDIYTSHNLSHLHPIVVHKMTNYFGSPEYAEEYYIKLLYEVNRIKV